ncbi:MAG: membrane protein insertion efficiency factor YidD [Candidatus Zixiibacteriota bacterium]
MPAGYSSRSAEAGERPGLATWPLIGLILLYRMLLAPVLQSWFGVGCRFYPTCSHYAEQALRRHGAWRGSIMAIRRLGRCHPWHEGGFDPVR